MTDRFNLRQTVNALVDSQCATGARVCVATGGIDSAALVMACLDVGIKPTIVSFTLDDRESSDFRQGRRLAEWTQLPFLPVYLSTDAAVIANEVWTGITIHGLRTKAAIETFYPISMLAQCLDTDVLITGHGSDGHFCVSKKGMMHFRQTQARFQQFRKAYFQAHQQEQRMLNKLTRAYGLCYIGPYWNPSIFRMFADSCWDDVNRPRQKEPIRAAFPELDALRIGNHRNLQLGDSGIAEIVGETMRRKYTPHAKSPVSAYNLLVRHYDKERLKRREDSR